jgi:hypothetical protein
MDKVRWDAYVHTASDASTYHLPDGRASLRKVSAIRPTTSCREPAGNNRAFPLVHLKSVPSAASSCHFPISITEGSAWNDVSNRSSQSESRSPSQCGQIYRASSCHPLRRSAGQDSEGTLYSAPGDVGRFWKSFSANREAAQRLMGRHVR